MSEKRPFLSIAAILVVAGLAGGFLVRTLFNSKLVKDDEIVVTHQTIVERMESMGKLELIKIYIKDIMDHTVKRDWWFDPKVVLMVSGEAVGCLDLTKIDSTHIKIGQDQITIQMPAPELCYFKI